MMQIFYHAMQILLVICVIVGIVFVWQYMTDRDNDALTFSSSDNAHCILECVEMGEARSCFSASASYMSDYKDSAFVDGECSCFLEKCRR